MNRPVYLPDHLTEQQLTAILHRDSPLLIIAGPGSGKTEVISWRVAHVVQGGFAPPSNVLVVTFTNKAALELKDRIQEHLPGVNVEQQMWVSTFHAFCAELLRRFRAASPFPKGFQVLDAAGQLLFVYANRKALGLNAIVKGREHDFYATVTGLFNQATEEMVTPDTLIAYCEAERCNCRADELDLWEERAAIAEAYRRYCALLREQALIDFAFLQRHAFDLLQANVGVLEEARAQWPEILVDEYQDTNAIQDGIVKQVAGEGANLAVVGDDDQSIYRFRGATVKNLLAFAERYPGATVVRLTDNFRSRWQIVDGSTRVIAHNPARFDKPLRAVRGAGSEVLLVYTRTAGDEALAVVDLLRRLFEGGKIRRWRDVAILLRSVRSYAEPYVDALAAAGIPYLVTGEGGLFERDDIRQFYDLFTFLGAGKPWGDRHVRHPVMGLREDTCAALKALKEDLTTVDSDEALRDAGVADAGDRRRLLALIALKRRAQAGDYASLLEVFYALLETTGYFARCEREGNAEALHNLGALSQLIAAFDRHGRARNLYPFLDYLKLLKDGGLDAVTLPPEDAVQVMTIHQAKGLEFPVVVLGAAMQGRLPSRPRKADFEIPFDLRASGGLEPGVEDAHLVDERKLFYVAATRARELLIIGTADLVNKRGQGPSQFLREMFGEDLRAMADWTRVYDVESREGARRGPKARHSYTQLAYYLQCPLRYRYLVVYGMEAPGREAAPFGANVHRALETIHRRARAGDPPSVSAIEGIVDETWVSDPQSDPEADAALRQAAIGQLCTYIQHHAHTFAQIADVERHFSFAVGDHILLGKVDLVRQDGEGVEIVDFKTSSSAGAASEQVLVQLALYALGAARDFGYRIARLSAHFLGDDRVETWDHTGALAAGAETFLARLLDAIDTGAFKPRRAYCQRCAEFRALCPHAGATG